MRHVNHEQLILNVIIAETPLFLIRTHGKVSLKGRPDILHRCLIGIHDTPLNDYVLLRTFFTTQDGRAFRVREGTRIPRMQHRFDGLLRQALLDGKTKNSMIHQIQEVELKQLVHNVFSIQLSEKGEVIPLKDLPNYILSMMKKSGKLTIIVGGFPHGDFHQEYNVAARISMFPRSLTASASLNLIFSALVLGIQNIDV